MSALEIDRLLGFIETVLLQQAGGRGLTGTRIERWRWDEPDITLTWLDRGNVSKNAHAIAIREHSVVSVDVNAWRDDDQADGHHVTDPQRKERGMEAPE